MTGDVAPTPERLWGLRHVRAVSGLDRESEAWEIPLEEPAVGVVLHEDPLAFALLAGEPLVGCAAVALEAAGIDAVPPVEVFDPETADALDVDPELPAVIHDSLSPLTPPGFLAACVREAEEQQAVVIAVRPVTDTVKQVDDGRIGGTVDRDGLAALASPVVVPASRRGLLAGLHSDASPRTLPQLVAALRDRAQRDDVPVLLVQAPATARRVVSQDDLRLLSPGT